MSSMLILAKTALAMMLGFIFAIICGLIFIPILKKVNFRQHVSQTVGERHQKKEGTPKVIWSRQSMRLSQLPIWIL